MGEEVGGGEEKGECVRTSLGTFLYMASLFVVGLFSL